MGWLLMAGFLSCSGCGSDDDAGSNSTGVFTVKGTMLTDPRGETIVLKGVNKMSVFDEQDPDGATYFPEIAKTGANSVRIVWQSYYSNGSASNVSQLDALIQNCIDAHMIPIVEVHDATCAWDALDGVVNYWLRTDMTDRCKKVRARPTGKHSQ